MMCNCNVAKGNILFVQTIFFLFFLLFSGKVYAREDFGLAKHEGILKAMNAMKQKKEKQKQYSVGCNCNHTYEFYPTKLFIMTLT